VRGDEAERSCRAGIAAAADDHRPGALEYRFELVRGVLFPAFVEATRAFEELRVEVEWDKDGARGGAAIEAGRLVDKWTGDRSPA